MSRGVRLAEDRMRLLTMGTFDLFHAGHVEFLRKCRQLSDDVWVGLNTDDFAESYKRRPTIDFNGRASVLLACRFVDNVVPNDQPGGSALKLIEAVNPDIIAATMDYHPSNGKNWFRQIGVSETTFRGWIRIEWIPYTEGVSSSAITARL